MSDGSVSGIATGGLPSRWLWQKRLTTQLTQLHGDRRLPQPREVEEQATHDGLRAQTAPPPGMRPGILPEPGPQRSDRCLRRSAGDTPLLAVPSLAGGDGADDTAVAFLVRQTLLEEEEEKRKEEEEVRKVQLAQVKAAKKELRERRQEMAYELVALRRNFLPSERTPSVERRIAQLVSALDASAFSKPPTRKRKKRRRKRTRRSSLDPPRLLGWYCW